MNILLVDDEPYSVESIASSLDWEALGITQVLTAYSKRQALSVFERARVDILLSDIEMPRGSGLDLVEEIRGRGFDTVCLLLTCYSEFEYASRAIKLGIFEYILKPVDFSSLTMSLQRAVAQVEKGRENAGKVLHGEFWERQQQNAALSVLWDDLTNQAIPPSRERIVAVAAQRGLGPQLLEGEFYLLLLSVLPEKDARSWSQSLLDYAMHNILGELVSPLAIPKGDSRILVVAPAAKFEGWEAFQRRCQEALSSLKEALPAQFLGYCCSPQPVEKASAAYRALQADAESRFSAQTALFFHSPQGEGGLPVSIDYEKWRQALTARDPEPILADIRQVLFQPGAVLSKDQLNALQFALIDTVYASLEIYHMPGRLPQVAPQLEGFPHSIRHPGAFYDWACRLLEETVAQLSGAEQSQSIIEQVRSYIQDHMASEITRNDIAAHVHFNPDYLSHIFRKQSGMSLSNFVLQERLGAAKDLLLSTSLPVREIALRTGFQSISYFSMQFKAFNGVTPLQYRKERAK